MIPRLRFNAFKKRDQGGAAWCAPISRAPARRASRAPGSTGSTNGRALRYGARRGLGYIVFESDGRQKARIAKIHPGRHSAKNPRSRLDWVRAIALFFAAERPAAAAKTWQAPRAGQDRRGSSA